MLLQYQRNHGNLKTINVYAMLKFSKVIQKHSQLSVCIDFRFNLLRNVKKVNWKVMSPWYREVREGLNWFGYCKNRNCQAWPVCVAQESVESSDMKEAASCQSCKLSRLIEAK